MSTGYVWGSYVWAPYVWADGVWAGSSSTASVAPVLLVWEADTRRPETWNKFNTLRPIGSDDVDFVYRASEHDPVIANSVIPVRITEQSEAP